MLAKIWDGIMEFLYELVHLAIGWLPNSPLQTIDLKGYFGGFTKIMGWINYFVPVGICLNILSLYCVAIGVWYAARWVLRIAKYID